MKILQVTNFFKPFWEAGGVARASYELSLGLSSNNHQVTIYTNNKLKGNEKNKLSTLVREDNIKIYYFENFLEFFPLKTLPLPLMSIFTIRKEVKKFDIIHIHEHRTMLAVIVCYYAKKYDIPYIIQAHGSVLPFPEKQNMKKLYDIAWGDKILKDASICIALTKTELDQYIEMGVPKEKIVIIPNSISISEYRNIPEYGKFRKKMQITNNEKIILYVGRIHASKGLDLLINAFYKLLNESICVKLVIIGPESDHGYQQKMLQLVQELKISDKIIITGFLDQDEKIGAFVDSDVFVTPRFSGFPLTFLEASICGCPIVTTNNGDNLNWIDKKIGFVVDYNSEDLKNAIKKLLLQDELRKEYSKNAKKTVVDCFSREKITQLIEKLYSDIVGDNDGK
jgi:glycosyltransferase involved in cell wall biosynthesis